jgi:anti-anti-sigma factor
MIVLGADAHKRSHTIAAVDAATGQVLGEETVAVGARGFAALVVWARGLGGERVWALEDCRSIRRRPSDPLRHAHRRTALVALRGELDLVTVSKVAEVIDDLEPRAAGVRHIVLDLRGLTFVDVIGLHELIKQNEYARSNHHNLAVVRGTTSSSGCWS